MSIHKSIAKSSGIIGAATLLSRVLGFIRDIIIARLFGVYVYAQAFVIAFKIPNLFRDILAEGAANSAFVPVFSEYYAKRSKEELWELANVVLNLLLVVLAALTVIGIVFAPVIVRLIAPGFSDDPYKLQTTIRLSRIIFPYILLISLASYCAAILNSLKHFTVPAFAPCLLNISIIVFALIFGEGIRGLSMGVLIGGLLQLVVQIPLLYKRGFRPRFFKGFSHPGARQIMKLLAPRLASTSIYQLNNFVDSIFGSFAVIVGEGGVAILYFAYRLVQFPIGIFSNSLSQAILPTFSTQVLEENHNNLKRTLSWGIRTIIFIMLPASVGFMVLSRMIIQVLFEGGRFDVYATNQTADVLFYFSIGLVAYGVSKVIQCCFFALKDTVTPAKVAFLALLINIALNAALMFPMKVSGLALATSISGIISCLVLFIILRKRLGGFGVKQICISIIRIAAASLAMGLFCFWLSVNLAVGQSIVHKVLTLGIIIICTCLSYVLFCFIFKVSEMRDLLKWLSGKKPVDIFVNRRKTQ